MLLLLTAGLAKAADLPYKAGELLVLFDEGGDILKATHASEKAAGRKNILAKAGGGSVKRMFKRAKGLGVVKLPKGVKVKDALKTFKKTKGILHVEPNYKYELFVLPSDPNFPQLWGMHNVGQTGGTFDADIDAPEAWDIQTGDSNVVVAVTDTGIDYTHPDLAANMWINTAEQAGTPGVDDDGNGYIDDIYGYDFGDDDSDPCDNKYHGTHVAGTIGAVGNNGIGVTGVCWDVKLMALKFFDANGDAWLDNAIDAIDYAIDEGADVINASWGNEYNSILLHNAIMRAQNAGIIFVAGAGNDSLDNDLNPFYPASYGLDNIISVMATDHDDQMSVFSNLGETTVDIGAPGTGILSTFPTYMTAEMLADGSSTDYETISGTSMAAPHVAGACALLKADDPNLTYDEIIDILLYTADPVLPGLCVSGGRLNLINALNRQPTPPSTGEALEFNGFDDFVEIADSPELSFNGTEPFTVSVWFKRLSYGPEEGETLVGKHLNGDPENANYILLIRNSDDTIEWFWEYGSGTNDELSSGVVAEIGKWYQAVGVWDGTRKIIYVNGVEANSSIPGGLPVGTEHQPINIGRIVSPTGNAKYLFPGIIDEVAIFNKALSAEEVERLYCYGVIVDSNTVGYWDFHEGFPSQVAHDMSGNNNDGTLGSSQSYTISDPDWVDSNLPTPIVYYVDDDANSDPCHGVSSIGDSNLSDPLEDGSIDHPFDSIQKAIDYAWSEYCDCNCIPIVIVRDGWYSGIGNYDIDPNGFAVTIKSQNGPEKCTINYQGNYSAFTCQSGEDANTTIEGFTITNRYAYSEGASIFCVGSSPTIRNCVIRENLSEYSGTAIWLQEDSNCLITDCTIINNYSFSAAAAIYSYLSSPTIVNCVVGNNTSYWSGSVTSHGGVSTMEIINCTIADNWTTDGTGGLNSYDSGNFIVKNSILWDNDGSTTQQIVEGSGSVVVDFSDVQMPDSNSWGGNDSNNMNQDPLFANTNSSNYHLIPIPIN